MEETRKESKTGLSLSFRRGKLMIHRATIRAIGDPEYIRFLINKKDRRLSVQTCEEIDRNHIRVPYEEDGREFKFEVASVELVSVIYMTGGWGTKQSYVIYGKAYPKHRLVEFVLDNARVITAEEFDQPELLDNRKGDQEE